MITLPIPLSACGQPFQEESEWPALKPRYIVEPEREPLQLLFGL